jgi:hypothetical protein
MKWLSVLLWLLSNLPTGAQQDSIREWRIATKQEHDTEVKREYVEMGKLGWIGDPPCTIREFMRSDGYSYSRNPCGLINSRGAFTDLIEITIGSHHCRITSIQEMAVMQAAGLHDGAYSENDVFVACAKGTLPRLVLEKETEK